MECKNCGQEFDWYNCPHCYAANEHADTTGLRNRLTQAEAIVNRLPQTADGTRVTPGCDVWTWGNGKLWRCKCLRFSEDTDTRVQTLFGLRPLSMCYGSIEAAEAGR